jgi:hypothetical protein
MGKSGRMVLRAGGVDGAMVMQWIDRMAGGTVEVNRQPGVELVLNAPYMSGTRWAYCTRSG